MSTTNPFSNNNILINRNINSTISPEAASASNNGTATGEQTTSQIPDMRGAKLVESLQGARSTAQQETANRLGSMGITGGQAASQLAQADRNFGLGMSQGLGQYAANQNQLDLEKLNSAAGINRDLLQLELQRQLGLGGLQLNSRQLDSQIALQLAQMAQNADTNTRSEIMNLMNTYFQGE